VSREHFIKLLFLGGCVASLRLAITPAQAEVLELINPSWREVPGTADPENSQSGSQYSAGSQYSDPAYINENSKIERGETIIYDLVNSDASYTRVEFNCETLQYRNLRSGYFESSTRVNFSSKVGGWAYPTSPYHSKLLTFVCFSLRE
jgi:hypothetical protein